MASSVVRGRCVVRRLSSYAHLIGLVSYVLLVGATFSLWVSVTLDRWELTFSWREKSFRYHYSLLGQRRSRFSRSLGQLASVGPSARGWR